MLSARAFYESDVRESSYRSPIDAFLPLYFSEAHFAAVKASGLLGRVLPPQPPRVLRVFGRAGSGPPEVNYLKGICSLLGKPHGVAVDGAGNVFVADCLNDRIQVFDAKGEVVRVFGREGCGVGELKKPTGVAVDGAGKVFVADNYNHRIGSLGPLVAKLYTVMNEMVVAVSSGEVHASVVYMRGFAQLHRLLLALALDDPAILAAVRQRVDKFLNHPDSG